MEKPRANAHTDTRDLHNHSPMILSIIHEADREGRLGITNPLHERSVTVFCGVVRLLLFGFGVIYVRIQSQIIIDNSLSNNDKYTFRLIHRQHRLS